MPATTVAAKTIRLCVNEKRLPEVLRNSFTSWENVLKELLQNARRAGASRIEVSYEHNTQTIEIRDDGCGIANMQDLLHIAESGWNEELKAEEHVFGIGFMSALYAGEEITVESGNERLSFNTTRALSFHDLPVETLPQTIVGTRLRLRGFKVGEKTKTFYNDKSDAEYLGHTMESLVRGFPVPVSYNGKELERPYALGSGKTFTPTSIGHMHILDIHNTEGSKPNLKKGGSEETRVFLQGFLVATIGHCIYDTTETNIVHLDSSTFTARMPDRDVLINAEKQKERIEAAIKDYWRDTLTRELPGVDDLAIVGDIYDTLKRWGMLSALNNIPYLPSEACEYAESRPIDTSGEWSYTERDHARKISRDDVETGECVLLAGLFDDSGTGYAYKTLAYKHPHKFVSLDADALDKDHWAFKYTKPHQDSDIKVIVSKPEKPRFYAGSWVSDDVILCDSMLFQTPYGEYLVNDCAIYTGSPNEVNEGEANFILGKKGKKLKTAAFIVPRKDTYPEAVVQQASSFNVENSGTSGDEVDMEARNFRHFLAAIQNTPPEKVLQDVLETKLDTSLVPNARGKSFILKIDRKGRITVSLAGKGNNHA